MPALDNVTRHAQDILDARKRLGLDYDQHPLEFYLALLEVESGGDVTLQDQDSYIGPYQIGDDYLQDAREYAEKHYLGLSLPSSREALRSDVYTSALVVMLHMERWEARHEWVLERMAALHKGGVGTAAQIKRKIKGGMSVERAIHWAATAFRYGPKHKRAGQLIVPRVYLYVYGVDPHNKATKERRFVQCLRDYTSWTEQHYGDYKEESCEDTSTVCPCCNQPLG